MKVPEIGLASADVHDNGLTAYKQAFKWIYTISYRSTDEKKTPVIWSQSKYAKLKQNQGV